MAGVDWAAVPSADVVGAEIHALARELYPICRSLTGDGVRATLAIVARQLALETIEVPSGTDVYDWTVPPEWNIRDAYVSDASGRRVVDFAQSNLHVLGYSEPVDEVLTLDELQAHLFTDARNPDWVPFRTSYYNRAWGFCLSQRALDALEPGEYRAVIDSSLDEHGALTYGEARLAGEEPGRDVLLSTYVCHPSLANDNVSGIAVTAILGRYLSRMRLRHGYRLLFSPGTIGPLVWLAANEHELDRIHAGLVVWCVGDRGGLTYKRSRRGDSEVDRAAANVVRASGDDHETLDFVPWGGDERQFCSPGFDLPVGCLTRTPTEAYAEYHSSADDLDFLDPAALGDSLHACLRVIDVLETNGRYVNQNPKGEPMLGRRGLYRSVAGEPSQELALLWVLNMSDGRHSLLDISDRSGLPFAAVRDAAAALKETGLLVEAQVATEFSTTFRS